MSASNPNSHALDYLCLSYPSLDPRLFAYHSKAMPGKRQVSFFHIWHLQQVAERIVTKASDVYCQLPLRWLSPLRFLRETK